MAKVGIIFMFFLLTFVGPKCVFAQKGTVVKAIPDEEAEKLIKVLKEVNEKSKKEFGAGEPITAPLPGDVEPPKPPEEEYPKPVPLEEVKKETEKEYLEKYIIPGRRKTRKKEVPGLEKESIPRGLLSEKEIKELKEKALRYREAITSPPRIHRGKVRIIPVTPRKPQQINTAVGYATVISFPFKLRKKNPAVVGDALSFNVSLLAENQIVIFAKKPFWTTNLIVFPEKGTPVSFFLKEAYSTGNADYYVEVKAVPSELKEDVLIELAERGHFKEPELNAFYNPKCQTGKAPVARVCILAGGKKIIAVKGDYSCIKGCNLWINVPHLGLTVADVAEEYELCENASSPYAIRNCVSN